MEPAADWLAAGGVRWHGVLPPNGKRASRPPECLSAACDEQLPEQLDELGLDVPKGASLPVRHLLTPAACRGTECPLAVLHETEVQLPEQHEVLGKLAERYLASPEAVHAACRGACCSGLATGAPPYGTL